MNWRDRVLSLEEAFARVEAHMARRFRAHTMYRQRRRMRRFK